MDFGNHVPIAVAAGIAAAVSFAAPNLRAQTWVGARETPSLTELVAVDATGEDGWPFGDEDIAADGLGTFEAEERGVDLRSAYAATDSARLWLRAYVSATTAPDPSLRFYVFVDADASAASGGSAAATEIEPDFTADPSEGGYEHVLGVAADATILGFWDYREQTTEFIENPGGAARALGEVGIDLDPLLVGADQRGYVQGSLELADTALTASCGAEFFLRTASDHGPDSLAQRVDCVPADNDGDRVPNVIENVSECAEDADCPAGGVCISGSCRYAPACVEDVDCESGEECSAGRCVATGGESCEEDVDCDGLVCSGGACQPCGAGAECASGQACGADGRCVTGSAGGEGEEGAEALVDPDEQVQGGAFTCAVSQRRGSSAWIAAVAWATCVIRRRRRKS